MTCDPDPGTGGAGHQARGTVVPGLAAKDSTGTGTFG
jgi:hypothetical protein